MGRIGRLRGGGGLAVREPPLRGMALRWRARFFEGIGMICWEKVMGFPPRRAEREGWHLWGGRRVVWGE